MYLKVNTQNLGAMLARENGENPDRDYNVLDELYENLSAMQLNVDGNPIPDMCFEMDDREMVASLFWDEIMQTRHSFFVGREKMNPWEIVYHTLERAKKVAEANKLEGIFTEIASAT